MNSHSFGLYIIRTDQFIQNHTILFAQNMESTIIPTKNFIKPNHERSITKIFGECVPTIVMTAQKMYQK